MLYESAGGHSGLLDINSIVHNHLQSGNVIWYQLTYRCEPKNMIIIALQNRLTNIYNTQTTLIHTLPLVDIQYHAL